MISMHTLSISLEILNKIILNQNLKRRRRKRNSQIIHQMTTLSKASSQDATELMCRLSKNICQH
jgi:hypothetical protein